MKTKITHVIIKTALFTVLIIATAIATKGIVKDVQQLYREDGKGKGVTALLDMIQ